MEFRTKNDNYVYLGDCLEIMPKYIKDKSMESKIIRID